ncbi:A-kinase-interacting protein 1 isoform X2 [Antennarius striatus]|uniref:A-kinase-interacting protein 1 isoform X2 n=1 Tax=Antennarius striatus TaxID=241820 RepID=UPI0035AF18A2
MDTPPHLHTMQNFLSRERTRSSTRSSLTWCTSWDRRPVSKFYESGCCPEPTEAERIHASRFHHRPAARTTPAPSPRKPAKAWAAGEDVLIAVSPGTYAVTASAPSSRQQTKLVSVKDGESIHVTFNLTPAHTCHLTTPVT